MAEIGFKSMSKLPVIAQGVCHGGEEKEKISPREEHVESCQHRRKEREKGSKGEDESE